MERTGKETDPAAYGNIAPVKIAAHLARMGGVIAHPRSTLTAVISRREGTLTELIPWIVIVTIAIAPIESGRAFLLFRASVVDGAIAFVSMIANRMTPALPGALVAAIVLYLGESIVKAKADRFGFDAALDAASFTLIPFLALAATGAIFTALGVELWWMPHRSLKGPPEIVAIRAAVAFTPSILLFALVAHVFWKRPDRVQ